MRARPRIARGVTVTPVDTPKGLSYRLRPAQRGAGTLIPARTFSVLLMMDGERTLAELHDALARLGVRLPDPGKLIAMVRLFEAAGIIDITHHFTTAGELRHRCEGCGHSCEGHLVGPIEADEAEALESRLAELRREDASIAPGPATVDVRFEGERHRVLHFPEGACIFLTDDKRCRLHAKWGATSKPLPCRMFPFRMVRTETGTRVAISPRCFRAHHSFESGPLVSPDDLLAQWGVWRPPALPQGLDPDDSERLAATAKSQVNRAHEALVLELLDGADVEPDGVDLATVLGRLVGPARPAGRPPAVAPAARRVFGDAVLEAMIEVLGGHFAIPQRDRPTAFGASVATLITGVTSLSSGGLADWNDLPEPAWRYARHCLRHFVFSREVMTWGSVRGGVLVLVMGLMAGRWLTPRADLESGRLDAFTRAATAWIRLAGGDEVQDVLFPPGRGPDALLATLFDEEPVDGRA